MKCHSLPALTHVPPSPDRRARGLSLVEEVDEKIVEGDFSRCVVIWENAPKAPPRISTFHCELQGEEGGRANEFSREIVVSASPGKVSKPRIQVAWEDRAFTFFVEDVRRGFPMWLPDYGVVVCEANESRSYGEVVESLSLRGLLSKTEEIDLEPEESLEAAAIRNRALSSPIWLGLGRDMRIFRVRHQADVGCWGSVEPCFHSMQPGLPETGEKPYRLDFVVGRGASCEVNLTRSLEADCLPILRSIQKEEDIEYRVTSFCSLETRPIDQRNVRGSEWVSAFSNTAFNMLSAAEIASHKGVIRDEMYGREEEVVCCIRVEAVNTARVPRYAWFKALKMTETDRHHFEPGNGFSSVGEDRVYGIHRLNGDALAREESAELVMPGETVTFEILIPHQPVSRERARRLMDLEFDTHYRACGVFWRDKLESGARITVPEKGINDRIQAGLLHCDLATLGLEAAGPLLPTIGWYGPIGSESAPIIRFFDSMGWHRQARRCLEFFLLRQREDGFMQNYNNYQLETGPILWTIGEHFRHTGDLEWVASIQDQLVRACEYLIAWRHRAKHEGKGRKSAGLQDGKVADPDDFFQSYMLNALSHLGIKRVAEILRDVDPRTSLRLQKEASDYREDIRESFREALTHGPLIPSSDGSWVPTAGPWAEYPGPLALYAEGGEWFTHGAFGSRDSLIGALHLVIGEVFSADEKETEYLLKFHQELFTQHNAGFSQPYYCRHDWIHLLRGEVKPFLKTYYNQITALQDRETYTCWEHYFLVGQHKTHEEAWFLMQTRWMLYREDGDTLRLLSAIPRRWLEPGRQIRLEKVSSYFGLLDFSAETSPCGSVVKATLRAEIGRGLRRAVIRLPHPEGLKPRSVEGGTYDPESETVTVEAFQGFAGVTCTFPVL